jgi:transcriptional regulator with XRE-family HTH domain
VSHPKPSNLKALREAAGLSTYALARLSHVKQPQVWRYERMAAPKGLKSVLAIAAALGVSLTAIWPEVAPTTVVGLPTPRPQHRQRRGAALGATGRRETLKSGGKSKR